MSLARALLSRPFKSETRNYALYGALFGLTFPLGGTILQMFLSGTPLTVSGFMQAQQAEPILWIVDTAPVVLGLFAALAGRRQDTLLQLNQQLNVREEELENSQSNLEKRVQERTHDLEIAREQAEKRAARLQAIAEISQRIAVTQDLNELFPLITAAISARLGFYHTGIFLLDGAREYAILQAANSEGGRRMLARGHRLRIGGTGIVSFVAQTGRARVALHTGTDALFFNNPDLPETRSELALPLNVGGQIIGVLDVQSDRAAAFDEEDVDTLNTLASQVAIVIQNARLFDQARTALETYVQASRRGWAENLENKVPGYSYLPDGTLAAITTTKREQIQDLLGSDRTVLSAAARDGSSSTLAIPVKFRDQVLGIIHIEARDANRKWSEDELALVRSISERTALALENARLFEETSRRAEQARIVSQITSRISESGNFERIMQTTIRELGQTLGTTRAFIQLEVPGSGGEDDSPHTPLEASSE